MKNRVLLFSSLFFALSCQSLRTSHNQDFLWKVINEQCVPNQTNNQRPSPCEEVKFINSNSEGYVVFKDRRGALQYLLMPSTKITGIEDPKVVTTGAINYFYEAWQARSYLSKLYNAPIPDEEISLAINSGSTLLAVGTHLNFSESQSFLNFKTLVR
jgi:CDP-diacylglycerol pyrophosphatase